MNRSCPLMAVAWAPAPLPAPIPTPAGPARDQPVDHLPAIQIIGTALRGTDAQAAAVPVTVLGRADIERSGARTTTELLQQLPVMQGMTQTRSVVGNDSRGYASVSIHNLGDAYTLVLLNGQRVAPFGGQLTNGALSGVDINTIAAGDDRTHRGADRWRLSAFKSVGRVEDSGQNLSLGVSTMRRSALRATARAYARDAIKDFTFEVRRYRFADVQDASAPATIYDFTGTFGWANPMLKLTGRCPDSSYVYNNPYDFFFVSILSALFLQLCGRSGSGARADPA